MFDQKCLLFCARKAASTAGDLRCALKICQRAVEIHRDLIANKSLDLSIATVATACSSSSSTFSKILVSFDSVNQAVSEYRNDPLALFVTEGRI